MVLIPIIVAAVVILWYQVFALRRQTKSLNRRLAEISRRLSELEGVSPETSPAVKAAAAHAAAQREDWETLVGTNWLNRLGAVVLVIGVALFLGYSLTQLGPAGKVAIGFALGLSMLTGGMVLERREVYRSYSYSVMGAGWAVLYFDTFAMHGVPAAQVIESATVGAFALIAVSAAMIFHAVRYRSETATALAYLLGFIGLNFTPVTGFAVLATLLLAVSLVVLAHAFRWFRLPLLGILLTYLGFALRYDASVSLDARAVLWVYWAAFECYDLLELRGDRPTECSAALCCP